MRAGAVGIAGGRAPGCQVKRLAYHAVPRSSGVQPTATSRVSSRLTASASACTDCGPAGGQSITGEAPSAIASSSPSTGRPITRNCEPPSTRCHSIAAAQARSGSRRLRPSGRRRRHGELRRGLRLGRGGARAPQARLRRADRRVERDAPWPGRGGGAAGRRSDSTQPATPPPSSARLISSAASSVPPEPPAGSSSVAGCAAAAVVVPRCRRAGSGPTAARPCAGASPLCANAAGAPAASTSHTVAIRIEALQAPCPPADIRSTIFRGYGAGAHLARAQDGPLVRGTAGRPCPRRSR